MDKPSPEGRALLAEYRALHTPTPQTLEREPAAVRARAAQGPAQGEEAPQEADQSPHRLGIALGLAGVAAAFALLFTGIQTYVDHRIDRRIAAEAVYHQAPGPGPQTPELRAPPTERPGLTEGIVSRRSPPPEPPEPRETTAEDAPKVQESGHDRNIDAYYDKRMIGADRADRTFKEATANTANTANTAKSTQPTKPAPPANLPPAAETRPSDLAAEGRLVGGARQALQRGDLAGATHLLERHTQEHPEGALEGERLALQAIVACRSGDRRLGSSPPLRDLRARFAGSPLIARVEEACAAAQ